MNKPYQPVSCEMHSELELAIMHGKQIEIEYSDTTGEVKSGIMTPVDIKTTNSEEFLIASIDNTVIKLRLDQISRMRIL